MTSFVAFQALESCDIDISDNKDNLTEFSNISSRDCSSDFSDLGDPHLATSEELPKNTPSINAIINGSWWLDDSQSDNLNFSNISGSLDSVDFDGYSDLDICEDHIDGVVNNDNNILNPPSPLTISFKKEEPSIKLANKPQACDCEPQKCQFIGYCNQIDPQAGPNLQKGKFLAERGDESEQGDNNCNIVNARPSNHNCKHVKTQHVNGGTSGSGGGSIAKNETKECQRNTHASRSIEWNKSYS